MMTPAPITLQDIYAARQRIAGLIQPTPLLEAADLAALTGAEVRLKLENQQTTGSFKLRGAANKILSLTPAEKERGVITVSSGNHGRAVSYVAGKVGVKATVCLPETVPANKREAICSLGAETIIHGENADVAMLYADTLAAERGLTMIHPFDDPRVIAGQGTIGLELLERWPQLDTVVVPLSGGGLLAGIALALKSANPAIRTIGVSQELGPAMVESLQAGKIVEVVESPTLADALAGGLNWDNAHTFPLVQQYVDETVLVSENEIAAAMTYALHRHHQVVEGGGAVGLAALLHGKIAELAGRKAAVVISGGNVDITRLTNLRMNESAN